MWNKHRDSKNTKLYEISSGTKLLFTFLSLKVFPHEERETQSFYADCFVFLLLLFFSGGTAFSFSCFWLLFLVSFFSGPYVFFSLSFHRLNKPFEIDSYISWSFLRFTWTQFVIMPWTTCLGLRHQISFCNTARYTVVWNGHKESKNTKLYEIGSGTKLLFTFLSLKVYRHEERKTQSFYAGCFYIVISQSNQCMAPVAHKFVWPQPALKVNLLLPRQELN